MRKLGVFIAIGLIFAAFPGEISNQLLVHRTVHGFVFTLLNYIWFLAIAYYIRAALERRLKSKLRARLIYFLLYGYIGLSIEWFVLHNYAFQVNPVQLMMFTFWAGMALTPCIMIDQPATRDLKAIQRGIARYILIWSAISLMPFVIAAIFFPAHVQPTRNFSILVFGLGALGLNYHFYRYFKLVSLQDVPAEPAAAVP